MHVGFGFLQLVREDIGQGRVVAAAFHVLEHLGGFVVAAGENEHDAQVGLGIFRSGGAEGLFRRLVILLVKGDDAFGIDYVRVFGIQFRKTGFRLGVLSLHQVKGGQVEHAAGAAEAVDGAFIDIFLLVGLADQGGHLQQGFLVQEVGVVLQQVQEFRVAVVLEFHIGDEAGAAQFRQHLSLEGGVHLGHVADFVFTHGRVAVHGQDAEDEFLVFQIALGNQLLEAFPVFAHAAYGGVGGIVALGHFFPGVGGALRAVVRQFFILLGIPFRRGIGHNLRAGDFGALVGGDFVQAGQEFLHGFALEFRTAYFRAVDQVFDLAFRGAGNDFLVVVGLERDIAGLLGQHVGGVGAVRHFLHGQFDALFARQYFSTELQIALLHAGHIVKMDFLRDLLAFGGYHPVIVAHLLALVFERLHAGFAAVVHQYGGDLQDNLGVEITLGVGDGYGGVDGAVHHFQYGRHAFHLYIFGHFGHLFRRSAGDGRGGQGNCGKGFQNLLHRYRIKI